MVEGTILASKQRPVALPANYPSKWRKGSKENQKEKEKEAKNIKTFLASNIKLFEADKFDTLLGKYDLQKFHRITPWTCQSTKVLDQKRATTLQGWQKIFKQTEQVQIRYRTSKLKRKHRSYLRMSRKNTGSLSSLSTIKIFTDWEINLPRLSEDYSWGS